MNQQSKIAPIFIFSLPRAGSTLLQRILTSHNEIASVAEPWLLLPLVYPLMKEGTLSEYSHVNQYKALCDFLQELPGGQDDYLQAVRGFATELYSLASPAGANFFIDKTPRYSLICDEIIRAFPDAKFIFLWRNPLSIISSMMDTWAGGAWNIYKFKIDLYRGMDKIISAHEQYKDKSISVRYEDLISSPDIELQKVSKYLGINFEVDNMLKEFATTKFTGFMGDPTGVVAYNHLSSDSMMKWRTTINNPWRKYWCKKYLNWLGEGRLNSMGYDLPELLEQLERTPVNGKRVLSDLVRFLYGQYWCYSNPSIAQRKEEVVKKYRHH